jgi:hypothetical protein
MLRRMFCRCPFGNCFTRLLVKKKNVPTYHQIFQFSFFYIELIMKSCNFCFCFFWPQVVQEKMIVAISKISKIAPKSADWFWVTSVLLSHGTLLKPWVPRKRELQNAGNIAFTTSLRWQPYGRRTVRTHAGGGPASRLLSSIDGAKIVK